MLDDRDTDLSALLTRGGDARLVLDGTGRNPYGGEARVSAAIPFGSCTCSSPSARGLGAAERALEAVRRASSPVDACEAGFTRVRAAIAHHLRLDSDTVLALGPSGTDLELIAAALVLQGTGRPLMNLVVGPDEVGSGTVLAAAGRHTSPVLPSGGVAEPGTPVDAGMAGRIDVRTVPVRDASGAIRHEADIDRDVRAMVQEARARGCAVLVHVVAFSKTGVHAPTLGCVAALRREIPDLHVMIDAAQGRFSRRGLQEVLRAGCLAAITGSKFFGGPPFSGALLVPAASGLSVTPEPFPPGFGDLFTRAEMPASWVGPRSGLPARANVGLLLRWEAALAEMDAYYTASGERRLGVLRYFEREVPRVLGGSASIAMLPVFPPLHDDDAERLLESKTTVFGFRVVPVLADPDAERVRLKALHTALLDGEPSFHLGQPVRLGKAGWALRVALGGELIVRVSDDLALGDTFSERLDWLGAQIVALRGRIEAWVDGGG